MTLRQKERETTKIPTWGREITDGNGEIRHQRTSFRQPDEESVASIMTRTTYCVTPDATVESAISILLERGMSGLPVVDADGRPVGLVSKTDLLRHLHENGDGVEAVDAASRRVDKTMGDGFHSTAVHGVPVGDVMMPVVFAVGEATSIAAAAALMAGESIHRVPVLADDGTVAGILSTLDIVRWLAASAGYPV